MSLLTVSERPEDPLATPHPPRVATTRVEMDAALQELSAHSERWAELPLRDRRAILQELRKDFSRVAERWAAAGCRAEGLHPDSDAAAEEWLAGPYLVLRNLRLLDEALADIERDGRPRIPGPIRQLPSGQVAAQVFPQSPYDQLFYPGLTADVWMEFGVTPENLAATQASAYHRQPRPRGVALVLGAGNVSSIGPMDILAKLFLDNQVVVCKMHPVNAYLGPLLAEGFQVLIDWGFLRLVYGAAAEGQYLCEHALVDAIHVTGSDRTVEAIAFGTGEEGARRKAEGRPRIDKPISSELGNVSPVIVVPGPWSQDDLDWQGENLAAMLSNNAGFNCNAARVVILERDWPLGRRLLHAMRNAFAVTPPRDAYYPGAAERCQAFLDAHAGAERIGSVRPGQLPWVLVPDVDPEQSDDICFRQEAFCSVIAQTSLEAASPAAFLDHAVAFANSRLWGTLNATILVHPRSLEDGETATAFARALENLRYGTIAVNIWAAAGYGLVVTPWGAAPGHHLGDIQSGVGQVHNTLMFERVQKTVVHAPFRMFPKPPWFASHQRALALARRVTEFEASPSLARLPGIFWDALRG